MKLTTLTKAFLLSAVMTGSAYAGNIALTGHDSDFHRDTTALNQIAAMASFVRNGSALPVLTFDHGTELTSAFAAKGISFFRVDPDAGPISGSLFNHSLYSAIAVASDETCGGCDNTATSIANLTAASAAISSFFNDGGGILAFSGATRASTYYGFLPSSASGFGSPPSTGFVQTAFGASLGIPAVNGDPTHNFFSEPGTGGVSSAYGVVERLGNALTGTPETIACAGCTISDGTIVGTVPEPATTALLGLGLLGFAASRRKSAKSKSA